MNNSRMWKFAALLSVSLVAGLFTADGISQTAAPKKEEAIALEKFEVTGSRLTGAAIEGSLSVSTYDMGDLPNVGYSNPGELLRKKLPQFGGGVGTINEAYGNGGNGAATVSLRNLPLSSTLFLVNGRRTNADLNLIPTAAVEKIEILNDGASPIYGSDAVAGVVNMIFKRHFEGAYFLGRYANTTDTDVGEHRASIVWGGRLGKKVSLTVVGERTKRNLLMTPNRKVSIPAGDSVSGTSNPGLFTPVATSAQRVAARATVAGDPGHAAGVTNANVLVPLRWYVDTSGTALTSPAQVPAAFRPVVFLTLPSSMAVAARNTARDAEEVRLNALLPSNSPVRYGPNKVLLPGVNPGFPFGYYTYGVRPQDASSVSITSDIEVADGLKAFADVLISSNASENALAASPLSGRTVPPTNYWYNQVFPAAAAAGNNFGFGYRPTEIGPRITYNRFQEIMVTAGVKGELAKRYKYQVAYLRDESKLISTQTGGVLATVFNNSLAATSAAAAFNPFSFTPLFGTTSPGNPQSLINTFTGQASSRYRDYMNLIDGNISGTVFELPAGPVAASVGVEWRQASTDQRHDPALLTGAIFPFNILSTFIAERKIFSYNAEVNVPIISSVSVSLAGRDEDYSDVGRTGLKPRVAARWEPLPKELTIRGSWAQGFIAPSLSQLSVTAPSQTFTELLNPLTSVRTQPTRGVIRVGNAGLEPTESDSYLVGVIYSPKAVKGLTVGMNYYRIEQSNIPFTSDQYIVNQWWAAGGPGNASNPFGPSAGRSAQNPLGAQVELNVDGSLNQVRNSGPINSGKRRTDGYDFFANHRHKSEAGEIELEASWTQVRTFEQENFPGAGLINYLGYYWPSGSALGNYGFPEWKGSLNASWRKGRYSAGLGYSYVDGYKEQGNANKPIPSYATTDVRLGYMLPWLEAQLLVGVNNVSDKQVPFISTSFENQYDRAIGDIRGRVYFVELSKRF